MPEAANRRPTTATDSRPKSFLAYSVIAAVLFVVLAGAGLAVFLLRKNVSFDNGDVRGFLKAFVDSSRRGLDVGPFFDLSAYYEEARLRNELPASKPTPEEFTTAWRKVNYVFFKPFADASNVAFNAASRVLPDGRIQAFLFDGHQRFGGSVNLTFYLRPLPGPSYKILYYDLIPYSNWALSSTEKERIDYRKRKILQYIDELAYLSDPAAKGDGKK